MEISKPGTQDGGPPSETEAVGNANWLQSSLESLDCKLFEEGFSTSIIQPHPERNQLRLLRNLRDSKRLIRKQALHKGHSGQQVSFARPCAAGVSKISAAASTGLIWVGFKKR